MPHPSAPMRFQDEFANEADGNPPPLPASNFSLRVVCEGTPFSLI
jgi:hypothetical protein